MVTYKDLIETVIKREMGIVGRDKALEVARQAGLMVGESGTVLQAKPGIDDLDRLVKAFGERFGLVAVVGCRVALMRLAQQGDLQLPEALKL